MSPPVVVIAGDVAVVGLHVPVTVAPELLAVPPLLELVVPLPELLELDGGKPLPELLELDGGKPLPELEFVPLPELLELELNPPLELELFPDPEEEEDPLPPPSNPGLGAGLEQAPIAPATHAALASRHKGKPGIFADILEILHRR